MGQINQTNPLKNEIRIEIRIRTKLLKHFHYANLESICSKPMFGTFGNMYSCHVCAGTNFTSECLFGAISACAILKWILNVIIRQSWAVSYHRMFTNYIASRRRNHINACAVPGATLCCSDNEQATPTGPGCVTEHLLNNIIYSLEVNYLLWAWERIMLLPVCNTWYVWTLHISNENGCTITTLVCWFL